MGERENGRARGRHAPSRAPVFSCAHYFQAPATQARDHSPCSRSGLFRDHSDKLTAPDTNTLSVCLRAFSFDLVVKVECDWVKVGVGTGERRLLQSRVKKKGIQSTPDNSNLQVKKKNVGVIEGKIMQKMIWREMKIASSYRGFELPGVDCSTFETISYPDLLLTKAKARSGQIRFVHVI